MMIYFKRNAGRLFLQFWLPELPKRPAWLTRLLIRFYWNRLPWADNGGLRCPEYTSRMLRRKAVPVRSLLGKPGHGIFEREGELYTTVYEDE